MKENTTYPKTGESGSIKWIILIVIGIIIASYFFDFSVQEAVEDEQTQSNFNYLKEQLLNFYNLYLRNITEQFWNFFIDNIWNVFLENMQSIENGEPTVFDEAAAGLTIQAN